MIQKLVLFSLFVISLIHAASFYLDPEAGNISNSGTEANPWSTLQEVFDSGKIATWKYETKPAEVGAPLIAKNPDAPVRPGDTLLLKNGYHGDIFASEYYNEAYITIRAFPGHTPKIGSLELRSGCRWRVVGLTISPSFAPVFVRKTLINFSSHNWTGPSRDCIAEACIAYTVPDASGWTMAQWDTLSCNGINLPGTNMIARNNYFKNVNFAIAVTGDSCLVEYNTVENFSGDGMRGLGDWGTFQYNTIKNCYDVNENHDDGFQSWSVGDSGVGTGVVTGIILRGNTIVNFEDPQQLFRGTLQGIGCFDGMFAEWLVENNVIRTDHWHGITLSGAINCSIINNTVVDLNDVDPGPPWIKISDHKDGSKSSGCVIRNNLTTDISTAEGVVADHNIIIKNYNDFFVNYASGNLHLKEECAAIDSGASELAPAVDRDGTARPFGNGIDVGAYEHNPSGVIAEATLRMKSGTITLVQQLQWIRFISGEQKLQKLTVFDCRGKIVAVIRCGNRMEAIWNTRHCRSGMYVVRYSTENETGRLTVPVIKN